jgi:hypothetical protein
MGQAILMSLFRVQFEKQNITTEISDKQGYFTANRML